MRPVVSFDLETTTDESLGPYKPEEPDAFAPAPWHRIEVIGVLVVVDGAPKGLTAIDEGDERETIQRFRAGVLRTRPKLIGWNTLGFDLPVLAARSMVHGITFPVTVDPGKPWETDRHEDTMLTLRGKGQRYGLDVAGRLVGWPGKLDASGKRVGDLLNEPGGREHLGWYCKGDTVLAYAVQLRVDLLRGDIEPDVFRRRAEALLTFVRAIPELAPWAWRVNEERWLLPKPAEPAATLAQDLDQT